MTPKQGVSPPFDNSVFSDSPLRGGLTDEKMFGLLRIPFRRIVTAGTPSDVLPPETRLPSSALFDIGFHNHRELHWFLAGSVWFRLEDRVYRTRPGDVFLVDRWQRHGIFRDKKDKEMHTAVILHFHSRAWGNISQSDAPAQSTIARDSWIFLDSGLTRLFERRCDVAAAGVSHAEQKKMIRPVVAAVCGEYARLYLLRLRENRSAGSPVDAVRVCIRRTLGIGCSRKSLAAAAGCTPTHLELLYRACEGESIRESIDKTRLDFVFRCRIVNRKTKEISSALGFSAVSNYCKWAAKMMRRFH